MTLQRFIAWRYLFSRKKKSVVNIISWISLVGLLVSTAALIVVLSVYNGIGEITKGLFNTFDPELIVEPMKGKVINTSDKGYQFLTACEDIEALSEIVEEVAWITYKSNQCIATVRGVDSNYCGITHLDEMLYDGYYTLKRGDANGLVVGGEIFHTLGTTLFSATPLAVHIPKRGNAALGMSLDQAFNTGYTYPMATFYIQQEIDQKYVVTNIEMMRGLLNLSDNECSRVAIRLKSGAKAGKVKKYLNDNMKNLVVKDRYDQQPLYYKVFRTERLGIYLILSLIIFISTLSLVASLSLLIINKKDDIFIMRSMGMTESDVRKTFLSEGVIICLMATLLGLLIGGLVCFLQQRFGIVKMGDGNFVVDAFPVAMRIVDFLTTFVVVMVISSIAVVMSVKHAKI